MAAHGAAVGDRHQLGRCREGAVFQFHAIVLAQARRAHGEQRLGSGLAPWQRRTTRSPGRKEERFCSACVPAAHHRSGSAARSASAGIGFGQASPASSHHSHSSRAWLNAAVTRVAAPARSALRSGCVRATRSFQARRISSALSGASSPSSHCARAICGYDGARLPMPSGYRQGGTPSGVRAHEAGAVGRIPASGGPRSSAVRVSRRATPSAVVARPAANASAATPRRAASPSRCPRRSDRHSLPHRPASAAGCRRPARRDRACGHPR